MGKEATVWSEEKPTLVEHYPRLLTPVLNGEADCIVPFRTEASWESYGPTQRLEEMYVNLAFARALGRLQDSGFPEALGLYLDVTVGPKFCRTAAMDEFFVRRFEKVKEEVREKAREDPEVWRELPDLWDCTVASPVLMAHQGLVVGDVDTDYLHPPDQRRQEEELSFDWKRADQAESLIGALNTIMNSLGKGSAPVTV